MERKVWGTRKETWSLLSLIWTTNTWKTLKIKSYNTKLMIFITEIFNRHKIKPLYTLELLRVKLHLPFLICLPASLSSFIRIRLYCGLKRRDVDDRSSMVWQARKLHYSLPHIPTYSSSPYEIRGYIEPRSFPAARNISQASPYIFQKVVRPDC